MAMLPSKNNRKHLKGQTDHLDAWLISYADLITLLFMLFVIIVSVSVMKREPSPVVASGHSQFDFAQQHSGTITMGTPYDDAYHNLVGIVTALNAEQNIAVDKSQKGVWIDIAAAQFFTPGSAEISKDQLPLIAAIARVLKQSATGNSMIEVEGHTDDAPLQNSPYTDNWDLASARASHLAHALIEAGIDPAYLRATSYAGVRPLVPNVDSAGKPILQNRSRNQRMVIRLGQQ